MPSNPEGQEADWWLPREEREETLEVAGHVPYVHHSDGFAGAYINPNLLNCTL